MDGIGMTALHDGHTHSPWPTGPESQQAEVTQLVSVHTGPGTQTQRTHTRASITITPVM